MIDLFIEQAVDATDDSEEAGPSHVKNPSQASLATSATGILSFLSKALV